MVEVNLTAAVLLAVVGALLSAVFTWFPGLNTWYASLEKDKQSAIMLVLLLTAAAVMVGLGCFGLIVVVGLVCTPQGILTIVINVFVGLITATVSNQGIYGLTKNLAPNAVKVARLSRYTAYLNEPKG
jgi:uncharacterized membrane protein YqjE